MSTVYYSRTMGRRVRVRAWLGRHKNRVVLSLAMVLIAGGGLFLWDAYDDTYGSAEDRYREAQSQLQTEWEETVPTETPTPSPTTKAKPKPKPSPQDWRDGDAVMRVAAPGIGQSWVVVQGTSDSALNRGPGHFRDTAMPGQSGNVAIAGHRQPGMFWDLDRLSPGQVLTVETRTGKTYTYRIVKNFVTSPSISGEVSSVPPGFKKGDKVLTLTTCNPKWDNYQRLIIHAVML